MKEKDPIENITEHVVKTGKNLPAQKRIKLYEDMAELIPMNSPRDRLISIIKQLKKAEKACMEFEFMKDEEK